MFKKFEADIQLLTYVQIVFKLLIEWRGYYRKKITMHVPVLLKEVIDYLDISQGKVYLDATFGGGGYAKAIIEKGGQVFAIDRDLDAVERARHMQIDCKHLCFSEMKEHINDSFDGIVFDFGMSSFQIFNGTRGFSFQHDGPLDMRMGRSSVCAKTFVNTYKESEIADIIYYYGEETRARIIAKAICEKRREGPFETTKELADLISSIYEKTGGKKSHIHPATLTFQGIRIFVNDEMREIQEGLLFAKNHLKPGGRLICVSFHSLEDRMVKTTLKSELKTLTKHVVTPSSQELRDNPKSRSARLRAYVCE